MHIDLKSFALGYLAAGLIAAFLMAFKECADYLSLQKSMKTWDVMSAKTESDEPQA